MLVGPRSAHGQGEAGIAIGIGYGVLSVSAAARLLRGPGDTDVSIGSRVRVTTAARTIQGKLVDVLPDSLVIEADSARLAFAQTEIRDLRVSAGQDSKWAKGWGVGFLVGGATGAVIGLASGDDQGGFVAFSAGAKAAFLGIGLGVTGSLIGSLVGAAIPEDVWAHARWPIDTTASVDLVPVVGRRFGLAGRVRF
jgi:hypothetical protein